MGDKNTLNRIYAMNKNYLTTKEINEIIKALKEEDKK